MTAIFWNQESFKPLIEQQRNSIKKGKSIIYTHQELYRTLKKKFIKSIAPYQYLKVFADYFEETDLIRIKCSLVMGIDDNQKINEIIKKIYMEIKDEIEEKSLISIEYVNVNDYPYFAIWITL